MPSSWLNLMLRSVEVSDKGGPFEDVKTEIKESRGFILAGKRQSRKAGSLLTLPSKSAIRSTTCRIPSTKLNWSKKKSKKSVRMIYDLGRTSARTHASDHSFKARRRGVLAHW